jgi:hypothetical protein
MGEHVPEWVTEMLARFSDAGRLFGHGVMYSPTSAIWERRQAAVPLPLLFACVRMCACVRADADGVHRADQQ